METRIKLNELTNAIDFLNEQIMIDLSYKIESLDDYYILILKYSEDYCEAETEFYFNKQDKSLLSGKETEKLRIQQQIQQLQKILEKLN